MLSDIWLEKFILLESLRFGPAIAIRMGEYELLHSVFDLPVFITLTSILFCISNFPNIEVYIKIEKRLAPSCLTVTKVLSVMRFTLSNIIL